MFIIISPKYDYLPEIEHFLFVSGDLVMKNNFSNILLLAVVFPCLLWQIYLSYFSQLF
jgi:hypothetical protein